MGTNLSSIRRSGIHLCESGIIPSSGLPHSCCPYRLASLGDIKPGWLAIHYGELQRTGSSGASDREGFRPEAADVSWWLLEQYQLGCLQVTPGGQPARISPWGTLSRCVRSLNHIKTETLNLECIQSHFHVDGLMLVLQRIYDLSCAMIASGFSA